MEINRSSVMSSKHSHTSQPSPHRQVRTVTGSGRSSKWQRKIMEVSRVPRASCEIPGDPISSCSSQSRAAFWSGLSLLLSDS